MKEIYFDNSATTELSEAAKHAMTEAMELYGNPSSLHAAGNRAKELLEGARGRIARTLGVRRAQEGELIFTSCGSEADNLALLGTAYAKPRRRGGRIISTDSEHPGVEKALCALVADGFDVVRIPTRGGALDLERFENALRQGKPFLVSIMAVNNETGARYDVGRAFAMAKEQDPAIVTHTDAVQAYLKYRFQPRAVGADLVTVSAHKIHGPKGIGALLVSPEALKRRDLIPWLLGGGQEAGFRSGTENTVGIAGFAAAAEEGFANLDANAERIERLRNFTESLLNGLPVTVNRPTDHVPHILNLTLPGIRSETMLHALSAKGIYVSNGSACSSHSASPSRALAAFGLTKEQAECSIRVSFSEWNTEDEVRYFSEALAEEINRLVRVRR